MAVGDIGSVLDHLEYDTVNGQYATALKLSAGVVAIWYLSGDLDGTVKTYPVSAAGIVGTMIDSWEFDTTIFVGSDYHPSVVAVSGNVFAVAYRGSAISTNDLHVKTMTIATDGTITKTAIETAAWASQPIASAFGGFIKKPGTTKYIAFWDESGLAPDGFMAVVNIDDDGTNISLTDSWEFDTAEGADPIIIHISGGVFAITYNNGSNRIIKTFEVSDAGAITKSWLDTETFGTDTGQPHPILLVSGSVYAIFSSATDDVKTFTISTAGIIAAVDTGVFYTSDGSYVAPLRFKEAGGDSYFVYAIEVGTWDGYAVTLPISIAGIIGSVIDSLLINSSNFQYGHRPVEVRSGIFVFPWTDTPGADGHISTADIDIPDTIYPSEAIARVTGIRHIYRPGIFRMLLSLGDVSNTIEIAEAKVRRELEIPEQRTPEPAAPRCEEGATSGSGANKYTCMGGVWTRTPEAAPAPPTEIPTYPSPWGGTPVSQLPGIEEYLERQRRGELPESFGERMPPAGELVSRVWRAVTPWREEEGETFGGEIAERYRSFADWIGRMFK